MFVGSFANLFAIGACYDVARLQQLPRRRRIIALSASNTSKTAQAFGEQTYWERSYVEALKEEAGENKVNQRATDADPPVAAFSWYCRWEDLSPFFSELLEKKNIPSNPKILVPGVGNDPTILEMHKQSGYSNIFAFDYAPSAVECCQKFLGEELMQSGNIQLSVADARDLSDAYDDETFDVVLDKGTLDSIYLIGNCKERKYHNLEQSVKELARVIQPGGFVMSVTAVATDAIDQIFDKMDGVWAKVLDTREEVYVTEDGFASVNVDATLLGWVRSST